MRSIMHTSTASSTCNASSLLCDQPATDEHDIDYIAAKAERTQPTAHELHKDLGITELNTWHTSYTRT